MARRGLTREAASAGGSSEGERSAMCSMALNFFTWWFIRSVWESWVMAMQRIHQIEHHTVIGFCMRYTRRLWGMMRSCDISLGAAPPANVQTSGGAEQGAAADGGLPAQPPAAARCTGRHSLYWNGGFSISLPQFLWANPRNAGEWEHPGPH